MVCSTPFESVYLSSTTYPCQFTPVPYLGQRVKWGGLRLRYRGLGRGVEVGPGDDGEGLLRLLLEHFIYFTV